MAQLNDLIVTGNSRFINKTYTSTADVNCITASSAAGATEHSAGTTGQALVSDGDSVYWGDPQHADTTDEAQHATSAATLDDTEFIEDNEPYLFRTAPSEAGNRVYEDAIVGGSVVWNQLVQNGDFSDGVTNWTVTGSSVTISASNNILTVEKTGTGSNGAKQVGDCLANHVYLCTADAKIVSGSVFSMRFMGTDTNIAVSSESWQTVTNMIKMSSSQSNVNIVYLRYSSSNVGTANVRNVNIYDLTQMFADPAIADYAYSLEQTEAGSGIAWLKANGFFSKDYYAYNAGGIESVKTSAKKVVGFNQWDEEYTLGNNRLISNNHIPVIAGATYYFKSPLKMYVTYYDANKLEILLPEYISANTTKTIPNGVSYIKFSIGSSTSPVTTYNHDICINFHWDGEKDGEYETYEEHTYPLGNDELRGLYKLQNGKIVADGDIKTSDGVITRKYGIVDLGTLDWSYDTTTETNPLFKSYSMPKRKTGYYSALLCSKYITVNGRSVCSDTDRSISRWNTTNNNICIHDSTYTDITTFKASLSGVYLVYELATPTTETADPYTNPQIVDNWGTEEFVDTRDVPVPVGHDSRYPKNDNYKLANIPAPPGGAGDYIVHTDEYGESVYEPIENTKVINNNPTLVWSATASVGSVNGIDLTLKMPANPNTNTVSTLRGDYTYLVAGPTVGAKQYSLIARDATGKYSSFTSGSGTAVTKEANRTDYFDISKLFYHSKSSNVAANGNMTTATLNWAVASVDLRYTLNINTSALTARKPVYLKFNANESTVSSITGATCYKLGGTANDDYWSQTLPTSADGMIYVEIGRGTRDYRIDLAEDQHYYQYTDKLHEYDSIGTIHSDVTTNVKGLGCVTTVANYADAELVHSDALGYASTASGVCSFAAGIGTEAGGLASHAEGQSTYTSSAAESSHVEGINSSVNLNSPSSAIHIEGVNCITGTTARGDVFGVHIEGHNNGLLADDKNPATRISGAIAIHIEGFESWANGNGAHVEGGYCFAKNVSHAEGYGSNAIGQSIGPSAHAEGDSTTADVSLLTESGHAHAEGDSTYAYPPAGNHKTAHAEGYATSAIGSNTHAGGSFTIANKEAQTAIGKYNATVSDALFIVGKGTATNSRSNAMYVTTAGNINCVSLTQTSDERLKENIKPLTTTDAEILNVLQSKQFTLKQDETHQIHYGFIAQDVEQELNALGFATSSHSLINIAQNEEGYYSLNYTELIPLLVDKVQALEARIAALENK